MDSIIQIFISAFRMLFDIQVFGVPFLAWFIIALIIVVVLKFLKGKK